jgi:LAO/AO transport system kinase
MCAADSVAAAHWLPKLRAGDRGALSRVISMIEDVTPAAGELVAALRRESVRGYVVGLTGPPGAGKSTLIGSISTRYLDLGYRVAVLLVDPSSPLTGGAILGDRIRFTSQQRSQSFYARSLGNRGHHGGVTAGTPDVIRALDAAGYEVILLETVGAGQSDTGVAGLADCVVCATPPGLGDSVQAIKAGVHEITDVFVVTKADRPGAAEVVAQLRRIAKRPGDTVPRPVLAASAVTGEGVEHLVDELELRRPAATRPPAEQDAT